MSNIEKSETGEGKGAITRARESVAERWARLRYVARQNRVEILGVVAAGAVPLLLDVAVLHMNQDNSAEPCGPQDDVAACVADSLDRGIRPDRILKNSVHTPVARAFDRLMEQPFEEDGLYVVAKTPPEADHQILTASYGPSPAIITVSAYREVHDGHVQPEPFAYEVSQGSNRLWVSEQPDGSFLAAGVDAEGQFNSTVDYAAISRAAVLTQQIVG